jgi:hypothetical protein
LVNFLCSPTHQLDLALDGSRLREQGLDLRDDAARFS